MMTNDIHEKDTRQSNRKIMLLAAAMLFVFAAFSVLLFFISLQSPEQVMVPHVVGKPLPEALIELQAKELYPRLQLRYSVAGEEKGTILEQSPSAGSIVKGGRRIELVVSQGTVIDTVQNYVGLPIETVQEKIQQLFTSDSRQYIRIRQPYLTKFSSEPAGTILEQNPAPGTAISNNMELTFVLSKGIEEETAKVPDIGSLPLEKLYAVMEKTALIFTFTEAEQDADRMLVTAQSLEPLQSVPLFSELTVEMTIPDVSKDGIVSGILRTVLPELPYPLAVSCTATYQNGTKEQLVTFRHIGGSCSLPYSVPEGTVLTLQVLNKDVYSLTVSGQ